MINWAIELNLGGCSKIGWPGLIAVEGDERNCQVYVQMLQRLRWKRFTVRGEQQVVCDKTQYQSIDSMRQLPKGFCEFQQDEMVSTISSPLSLSLSLSLWLLFILGSAVVKVGTNTFRQVFFFFCI